MGSRSKLHKTKAATTPGRTIYKVKRGKQLRPRVERVTFTDAIVDLLKTNAKPKAHSTNHNRLRRGRLAKDLPTLAKELGADAVRRGAVESPHRAIALPLGDIDRERGRVLRRQVIRELAGRAAMYSPDAAKLPRPARRRMAMQIATQQMKKAEAAEKKALAKGKK